MNQTPHSKIIDGTAGVGTVSPQMIDERACEIAHSEGRARPNDLDRTRAREEFTGATSESEQPPTKQDSGRGWGMPLVSSGEKAPTVRPEDDGNIPDELIGQGIDEADHDQRRQSSR